LLFCDVIVPGGQTDENMGNKINDWSITVYTVY